MAIADAQRGTGRTTRQIRLATYKAHYVWCNEDVHYPASVARSIGRGDITFHKLSDIDFSKLREVWMGRAIPQVVVDHAVQITAERTENIQLIEAWCRSASRAQGQR